MESTIGTLVVNEKIYPIAGISLRKGVIMFHVALRGRQELPLKSEVRVHAPDGSLVMVAPWVLTPQDIENLKQVTPDGMTYIGLPVEIESTLGWTG